MKKLIGYLESTAFKRSRRRRADEKKNFPTKNPPIATFLGLGGGRHPGQLMQAPGVEGANLPDFVVRAVSGLGCFALGHGL
jgi:hypothetical protein